MTLSNMLYEITSSPEQYGCHSWSCRISGDMLELSVKPSHSVSEEEYREAVIHAGRVLEAIDYLACISGQAVQIRSFPNLENSRLVALIRLYQSKGTEKPQELKLNNHVSGHTSLTLLKSIASHYGLFFNNHNGKEPVLIHELMLNSQQPADSGGAYFSVCTMMDNPFVWIKTGQWIEKVSRLIADHPSIPVPTITCKITREERFALNRAFADCSYIQALVQLSEESLTKQS